MRDGAIVAGIVADDPAALTAAYDQYAPALYGYCWSLLSDPSNVAGAVRDTFVVAAARLSGLRDPSRLRPWLYSVARNECRRRRRYDPAAAGVRPSLRTGEDTADFGMTLEEAEQRELVWSALGALAPGDREIIELSLRHEFYGADLADALGVPRNQVHALTTRAQARFETALGARMMTRSRVRSCPGLAAILDGAGEDLSPALRRQVRHHMAGCDFSAGAQVAPREFRLTALLSPLPVPVMLLPASGPRSWACWRTTRRTRPRNGPRSPSGRTRSPGPASRCRWTHWPWCGFTTFVVSRWGARRGVRMFGGGGRCSRRPPCITRRPSSPRRSPQPSLPSRRPHPPALPVSGPGAIRPQAHRSPLGGRGDREPGRHA